MSHTSKRVFPFIHRHRVHFHRVRNNNNKIVRHARRDNSIVAAALGIDKIVNLFLLLCVFFFFSFFSFPVTFVNYTRRVTAIFPPTVRKVLKLYTDLHTDDVCITQKTGSVSLHIVPHAFTAYTILRIGVEHDVILGDSGEDHVRRDRRRCVRRACIILTWYKTFTYLYVHTCTRRNSSQAASTYCFVRDRTRVYFMRRQYTWRTY